jgi:N-acyl-D-amino-acid deacylase
MHPRCSRFLLLCLLSPATTVSAATYDLIVRGGRVADGTGNPAYHADVAVKDGRIAAIGKFAGDAREVLDATGCIVAPGFIDVHAHGDDIENLPLAENFVRMGVTTIVNGNCGGSKLNLAEHFKKLEDVLISVNVATLIGQGTVRRQVMGGSFLRPPTDKELDQMRGLVDQAMKDGAVGLSTGLIYLPGTFTKTEELIELARVAAKHDGIYVSHMRTEGTGIFGAIEELMRIAREAGIRAEISHIKLSGKSAWGQADKVLALIEAGRAGGLDITQDQYMYPASSTGISARIPEWAREGGDQQFLARYNDPAQHAKMVADMKKSLEQSQHDDFSYVFIASYRYDKSLNGLNVREAARKTRGADTIEDQIELMLEINKNGGASAVYHSMNEEDLQRYLQHPNTMIAADSGVRAFGEGVPHPRGYGNNARALARYVRELQLVRLEDMIRKMTSLPATTFRLEGRGELRVGNWADITVFDPAKVQDHATFKEPHQFATGFKAVIVNGEPVVRDDQHTKARPGRPLRHRSPANH